LRQPADDLGPGGLDESCQFVERIFVERVLRKLDAYQNGGLALDALLTVVR
jgi:hypothetical protein